MAKKVVVVRVGTKTIHIVHMDNAINNPTIYGCVRVPTPEGAVNDGTIVNVLEVGKRIKTACEDKGIMTKEAIFVVSSTKIASRETTIPAVNKNKLEQVINAKIPELFPVDSERYIFSHVLQGDVYEVYPDEPEVNETEESEESEETETKKTKKKKMPSEKLQDVRVFAAPSELVESYYTLAGVAGMTVEAVEADGNAVFQMMSRQVRDGVTMTLQIGRDSTSVNIISGDKLYLQRVVPYGVSVFTDSMLNEEVFQVSDYDQAYQVLSTQRVLLHSLNNSNPTDDFSLAKRIEVTDNGEYLINNIARVIEYYNTRHRDEPVEKIVCVGQGCSVAGLLELLSNELEMEVTMPESLDGVRFNREIEVDSAILQYINCFGAVFSPVRFMTKEEAIRLSKKGTMIGPVMIFSGLMLGSLILAILSIVQVSVATVNRDRLLSRYKALAPVANQYESLMRVEDNYKLSQEIEKMVTTNNNNFHKLMDKLSTMVPETFRIQSIQSDEESVTISAVSTDRLSSLSALQIQLNQMEEIDDVYINEISETEEAGTGKRQYTYTLTFMYKKAAAQKEEE